MSGILLATVGNSYGSAPVNTVAPVVSGTATVGQTLTTTNGTWLGAPAPTFTYQWQRTGVDIGGATSSTYVLVAADYANTIRCVVRATNSVAPSGVTANSNSTASVAGNAPVNTVAPVVSGTAAVGQTLTTTNGTWTGVPTPTFTYQWQRTTTNISGATSSTYVIVTADTGNTIRCVVTATNAVSAVSANSNSTASVPAAPGQQLYEGIGPASNCFTWVAPAGVTSVSVITVGMGGKGSSSGYFYCCACYFYGGGGGGGGGLAYKNNITVIPGNSYAVSINTSRSRFICNATVSASIGSNGSVWFAGPPGAGNSGDVTVTASYGGAGRSMQQIGGGGGGAAGYGAHGACEGIGGFPVNPGITGGGSGGGGGGSPFNTTRGAGGGGGVGVLGTGGPGCGGLAGTAGSPAGQGGGGGGVGGVAGTTPTTTFGGAGGKYGGGGGGSSGGNGTVTPYGYGAVRIIWPGTCRAFPSTRTADE